MAQAVTAECAYTTTGGANGFGQVYCEIYVDATGGLISGGVSLNSSNLTVSSATKNGNRWFFGDGPPPAGFDYPNSPDMSNPSAPVVLVGHFDTSASPTIVDGNRELIGTVTFDRTNSDPPNCCSAVGRGRELREFCGCGWDALGWFDCFQSGDYIPSGVTRLWMELLDLADISATRYFVLYGGIQHPWTDCTGEGTVDLQI